MRVWNSCIIILGQGARKGPLPIHRRQENRLRKSAIAILSGVALASHVPLHADGVLTSWSAQAIEGMTEARWDSAKRLGSAAALDRIRRARDWATVYEGLLAASAHASDKVLLRQIAEEISNPAQDDLASASRLIIWERIRSGDILFEGKGLVVDDDLFRVAGRANWTLRTLLKKEFGFVKPDSSQAELAVVRLRWEAFLSGQEVPEVPPAYPSKVERFEELRSPAALAALIHSLASSSAKDTLIAACLKKVYGLDAMPVEVAAPARFCNPDTYTHQYLAAITDVADQHSAEWWKAWWQQHQHSLGWDSERAKFLTSAP
jgi:hypothetical protein